MKTFRLSFFAFILGLFLLSFLLEKITPPIHLQTTSPTDLLSLTSIITYPFTSAIVLIRGLFLFLSIFFFLLLIPKHYFLKTGLLLILIILSELYTLQSLGSKSPSLSLEWLLSISLTGLFLLAPMFIFFIHGLYLSTKSKLHFHRPLSEIQKMRRQIND